MSAVASQITGVSIDRLYRRRSRKTPKLCVTGLCEGNPTGKGSVTRKMSPFDDVIVNTITLCAASDENFIKMSTFPFQWLYTYPFSRAVAFFHSEVRLLGRCFQKNYVWRVRFQRVVEGPTSQGGWKGKRDIFLDIHVAVILQNTLKSDNVIVQGYS